MRRRLAALALAVSVAAPVPGAGADTTVLEQLPVVHAATPRGTLVVTEAGTVPPTPKVVDGRVDDWTGTSPMLGGTAVYSAGELVYTDHVFDAFGADDGRDAERLALLDPLEEAVPQAYRVEGLAQSDPAGQFGIDLPHELRTSENYGAQGFRPSADLLELRAAADGDNLYVLARTTTMLADSDTAVLLLADTRSEPQARQVSFGAGITSLRADVAVFLASDQSRAVDLDTGEVTPVHTAVDSSGYTNAIEAAIPRSLVEGPDGLSLAAATGLAEDGSFSELEGAEANLANVAFRLEEPVRTWFDKLQALSLHSGTIDPFFLDVDLDRLLTGASQTASPGPGYHDRIFVSAPEISTESGQNGVHQHYGLYVPATHDPAGAPVPLQFWLHWRGGKAHSAAASTPRVMQDMGEDRGGVVVSPRGRGTSTWYLGHGHVDFLEVWDDVFELVNLDTDRVYVSGHSMGGFGSYLLSVLYPDRFAAALPVAGPVTQGAWTGVDFEGCDDLASGDYSPCYIAINNSDPRVQHTRRLLDNLRNVPIAVFHGAADELVPVAGVTRQVERLVELGYRHRYYLFPTYEHYSHPIADQWAEGIRYMDSFVRDPNPARVTYVRDMPFERTVEIGPNVQAGQDLGLSFDFDSAYWMSGLTPADPDGVASVDAVSMAIDRPRLLVPEAGGPASLGQTGPYAMTGLSWVDHPLSGELGVNGFWARLTGSSAVRLDLVRMQLATKQTVVGALVTDTALEVRLRGDWTQTPTVTVNGEPVGATLEPGGDLRIELDPGVARVVIQA